MAAHSVFRPGATALISGGASGVGFAFAQVCRKYGMNLALLDINSDGLTKASEVLPSKSNEKTEVYKMDVTSVQDWERVRKDVEGKFGAVDLLILNAGIGFKPEKTQSWEDINYFQKTIQTNLFGYINGLASFLPLVQKSSGASAVIMTGSKQGITNPPGNPAYNASKSAVKTLAEHLSHDMRSSHPNITIHLLIPGWTFTGLSGNKGPVPDEEAMKTKSPGAWLPSQVVEYAFKKMSEAKFYIVCPDNDVTEELDQARMTWGAGDAIEGRSALSRWDPKVKDQAATWIKEEAERRANWPFEAHQPTVPEDNILHSPSDKLSAISDDLKQHLRLQTVQLKDSPNNPKHWLARANTLLLLIWPELALGDTYKAELLISRSGDGENIHHLFETYHQCFWLLKDRERQLNNNEAALARFPNDEVFKRRQPMLQQMVNNPRSESQGGLLRRNYPWMRHSVLHRCESVIGAAQKSVIDASRGRCTIQPNVDTDDNCYGVFATKRIKKGDVVFTDFSHFIGLTDMTDRCLGCGDVLEIHNVVLACCETRFCSHGCAISSKRLFHQILCSKHCLNFQHAILSNPTLGADDISRLNLLLRVLASAVQHPNPDPLQVPIINQLSASYGGSYVASFDFDEAIVIPTTVLQDLGVDIFANHFYDTWVIQVILARIRNNHSSNNDEQKHWSWHAIHPLFTFLNHSCRHNAKWNDWMGERPNMLTVYARRDIQAGEEITITYDGDCESWSWREREKYLEHWMPSGCHCERCRAEKAADN